ncbi:hypothetical protein [Acinetobacter silvestris]|uniref:Uncharacterized protein n=1 Tax=Acinetobacter silvestris TaxID=1977882 RepID=A0A1Y3CKE9_9GAMM|nr:hypothetical protein [Acinetobacter silvestris]OTG67671.1 hypothetical protein B9T28_03390 [Acinetobacter silvestris]
MGIKITNSSDLAIQVCINKWSNEGDTMWFIVRSGASESWIRDTDKPMIMLVEKDQQVLAYCVYSDSQVIITNTKITDRGLAEHPLS